MQTKKKPIVPKQDKEVIDFFKMEFVGNRFITKKNNLIIEYFPVPYWSAIATQFRIYEITKN